ncbi:MAG: hypothetical protein RL713_568, partial [Bacteroidota bacterium]
MPLIEISIPKSIANALSLSQRTPGDQQRRVLKKLLKKAAPTEFGRHYQFGSLLGDKDIERAFRQAVPHHDYNTIYNQWWKQTLEGKTDVCWPGKINYYALSSGTSEAASKYIPISKELMKGNKIIMIKQLLSLRTYENIPWKSVGKGYLMLGGSTELQEGPGYFAGDLSGITAKKAPLWF